MNRFFRSVSLFLILFFSTGNLLPDEKARSASLARIPHGIPPKLWQERIASDNPVTPEKVELGRKLFFDKRLSHERTLSCASCHDPATAFADRNAVAIGIGDQSGTRNTPTLLNAMFNESLFWDGRAVSLEEQAKGPLVNPREMGMKSYDQVVDRAKAVREYADDFRQVFGKEGITIDTIVKAIASFERTLLSGNAPFDRFISGDSDAISPAQKRGWALFQGKARCIRCHVHREDAPFFTDSGFHNTGVSSDSGLIPDQTPPSSPPLSKGGRSSLPREDGSEAASVKASEAFASPSSKAERTVGAQHSKAHGGTDPSQLRDLGRYLATRDSKHLGAFKTPTLRDIELTSPYMHDGSIKTLLDIVRFYHRAGSRTRTLIRK